MIQTVSRNRGKYSCAAVKEPFCENLRVMNHVFQKTNRSTISKI